MADAKITALTALAAAATGDILPIVDDPTGVPETKKITVANLAASIPLDTLAATTDITDRNASSSAHGLLPKLANTSYSFLNGLGVYDTNLADGWISRGDTWTYASASTFTVAGDVTTVFTRGVKLKLTQTTVKYFYVISSSYGAPNTTITITGFGVYTLANAAITNNYFSRDQTPSGFDLSNPYYLTTPLTSASYDGNDTVVPGTTTIDTSAVFGAPANISACIILISGQWAAASSSSWASIRPVGGSVNYGLIRAHDTYPQDAQITVTCDANGDFDLVVNNANMTNTVIRIVAYML